MSIVVYENISIKMSNNADKKYHNICDGCICELLNDPEIIISQEIFHNNICRLNYEYCKKNVSENELYKNTGKNFFVNLVEFNAIKYKIRNETINYLVKHLEKCAF